MLLSLVVLFLSMCLYFLHKDMKHLKDINKKTIEMLNKYWDLILNKNA